MCRSNGSRVGDAIRILSAHAAHACVEAFEPSKQRARYDLSLTDAQFGGDSSPLFFGVGKRDRFGATFRR